MSKAHRKYDALSPVSFGLTTGPAPHRETGPKAALINGNFGHFGQYSSFLARQFKASEAFVFLAEDTQNITNPSRLTAIPKQANAEAFAKDICSAVAEMKDRLVINDTNSHPLCQQVSGQSGPCFGAFVGMPIYLNHNDVVGTICVVDHKIRYWTAVEVDFISSIANEIGNSLDQYAGSSEAH